MAPLCHAKTDLLNARLETAIASWDSARTNERNLQERVSTVELRRSGAVGDAIGRAEPISRLM
jgi:hypothetical protein